MAKDIYLVIKQCAVLSPRLGREEAVKSSPKQDKGELSKRVKETKGRFSGGTCEVAGSGT